MSSRITNIRTDFQKRYKAFPNFISGIVSVFTAGRNNSVYESLQNKTVEDGLRSDWENIGRDIKRAMNRFDELKK